MPRAKGSKNNPVSIFGNEKQTQEVARKLQDKADDFIIKKLTISPILSTLDATMPTDNNMTNNQVRASIRETRAKVNEIINILNVR